MEIPQSDGGHGGGDPIMLDEIFGGKPFPDPFHRAANHIDGARSILTGIAANESFRTGLPVKVDSLLRLDEWTSPAVDHLPEVATAPAGDPAVLAG